MHLLTDLPQSPSSPLKSTSQGSIPFTTDERALGAQLKAAADWAAAQLMELLLGEEKLMARLSSIKHYFLLDQVAPRH